MPPQSDKTFSVPDRGITQQTVGFSLWLEYLLAGGLTVLFLTGVLVDGYLEMVFNAQVYAVLLLLFSGIMATLCVLNTHKGTWWVLGKRLQGLLSVLSIGVAVYYFIIPSFTQIGDPSLIVRLITYLALLTLGYWAWGCWLWIYGQVWLHRSVPAPEDEQTERQRQSGRQTLKDIVRRFKAVSDVDGMWKCWHCITVIGVFSRELFAGPIGRALLDPVMFYPQQEAYQSLQTFFTRSGHRLITPDNPARSSEYDSRRLATYKSLITGLILLALIAGIFEIKLPRRETPKGVLGGTGNRIARGKVPVNKKKKKKQQREKKKKEKKQEKVRRPSALKIFKEEMEQSEEELEYSEASVTEDAGLPSGQGSGATAAGSPKGTKVGGKYYMFRIKHEGNWEANRRGIPALMSEFTKVWNVKTNRFDQPVKLSDLRRHSGDYFPVLLYITGNGKIGASQTGVDNIKWYLENGGFIFADSSGGDFYQHFVQLLRRAFPDKRLRRISYDHTIFRGKYMPWRLNKGVPMFRNHPGPNDAQGLFIDGRLAVFCSNGDLGAAWASVGWGSGRQEVELAFRMGINILTYAMLYGGEEGISEE